MRLFQTGVVVPDGASHGPERVQIQSSGGTSDIVDKERVKLKPLRVWKGPPVNGALLMALIAQLLVSLTLVDLKSEEAEKNISG